MQPEVTPERARLIAALTDQPFDEWPGYRWTKLGDPMRADGAESAIAIHPRGCPPASSFFRVWLETSPAEHFPHVRGTGLSPQRLRWTINVPSATDAAALYVLY